MSERLTHENFDEKVLANDKLTLVEFYSNGCLSCKMFSPELAEVEEKYGEQIYVGKVNTAYDEKLTERFEITASPTLIIFKGGKQVFKFAGVKEADELSKIIEENM